MLYGIRFWEVADIPSVIAINLSPEWQIEAAGPPNSLENRGRRFKTPDGFQTTFARCAGPATVALAVIGCHRPTERTSADICELGWTSADDPPRF